jgi:hypothetical protein
MTKIGMISDSACGASHAKVIDLHKDPRMTGEECTLACVKYGAEFPFVSDGKVYKIANQNLAALAEHAGESVILTGSVYGNVVTVSKVAATGKKR